eukprot:s920_g3.t1
MWLEVKSLLSLPSRVQAKGPGWDLKPEILILDEPTNHLDIESVEALIDALKRYHGGFMLVSHDARLIQAAECELWVCRGGGESLAKAASFEEYRRQVLTDLQRRQQAAAKEAARRALERQKRRAANLGRRPRTGARAP